MNTTLESQFGITAHAQIQKIEGKSYEFQPKHLCCDDCWKAVDTAYSFANIYGTATASYSDKEFSKRTPDEVHSVTVSVKQ